MKEIPTKWSGSDGMPGIEKMKRKDGRSEGKKKRLWDGRKKKKRGNRIG